MDGFEKHDNVIVIAATNLVDSLDPALVRPGRFDTTVTVAVPDVKGREEILKLYLGKVRLRRRLHFARICACCTDAVHNHDCVLDTSADCV